MIGKEREGWALLSVMMLFMVVGCAVAYWAEAAGNPLMQHQGVAGGNMEGKEVRFGIPQSVTWATFTTGAPTARSTRCTTPTCRSVDWCRSR
jgi:potassium-transporting ATPase potassium-binding subunit